jgi:glycosyltransferase involved in cell wall biosynthesis
MVITNLSGSGAERVTLNLAEMFVANGHKVDLILLEDIVDYIVEPAIRTHSLTRNRKPYKWAGTAGDHLLAVKLKKLISRLEQSDKRAFNLILSHLPAADKVVSHCHLPDTWYCIHSTYSGEINQFRQQGHLLRARRKQRLYKNLYTGKKLIAVSQGAEQDVLQNMQIKPLAIHTIYNPFNVDKLRNLASCNTIQLPQGEFILHAGAFRPVKRHDILLKAFSLIEHNIKLVLLTNPCHELNTLIKKLGLEKKVLVAGHQENPYPFIRAAKLMVLSSEREGLPTVVIESLICGTPVVSTDCPSGPREILTGELAEWLTPVNDSAALAKKIDQALDTAINLDDTLIEKFTSDNVYQRYSELVLSAQHSH